MSGEPPVLTEADLYHCAEEPIHIPGAIQPHGGLLALRPADLTVAQISANLPELAGRPAEALLGQPLTSVIGSEPAEVVRQRVTDEAWRGAAPLRVELGGRAFDGLLHVHQELAILELEPAEASDAPYAAGLGRAIQRLQAARGLRELQTAAVEEIRALTGFDRVMLYRFDADGHGEVLAEARAEDMEPYLGLHYPASDIPRQARELYRQNWLRLIPEAAYDPVPLIPSRRPDTGAPLDLSFAVLRSVSPVHREYLKNMGLRASMSVSLLQQDRLWGLVSCGHRTPKFVPWALRRACETLGQLLSLQIAALEEVAERQRREAKSERIARLAAAMRDAETDVLAGLAERPTDWLELTGASGAAVVIGDDVRAVGECPSDNCLRSLGNWLQQRAPAEGVFHTTRLAAHFPAADPHPDTACGLLAVTLPKPVRNAVLWFRPEVVRTVHWGGDPRKPAEVDTGSGVPRINPRRSFELWKEEVRGRALPWQPVEIHAAEDLRRYAVEIDLARQVQRAREAVRAREDLLIQLEALNQELQVLTSTDSLTGIANRREFNRVLDREWRRAARANQPLALLMIDVDHFKRYNDTYGHPAGDECLKGVVERVKASVGRPGDLIARYGGEEMTVLLPDTDLDGARCVANRIHRALADRPIPFRASPVAGRVTVSVGAAATRPRLERKPLTLITEADRALYDAKHAGRNRTHPAPGESYP